MKRIYIRTDRVEELLSQIKQTSDIPAAVEKAIRQGYVNLTPPGDVDYTEMPVVTLKKYALHTERFHQSSRPLPPEKVCVDRKRLRNFFEGSDPEEYRDLSDDDIRDEMRYWVSIGLASEVPEGDNTWELTVETARYHIQRALFINRTARILAWEEGGIEEPD